MASIPLLLKNQLECLDAYTQFDSFGICPVKQALTAVAQEVRELLQQSHPLQTDSINRAETIMIRAFSAKRNSEGTEPEYRQVIEIERTTFLDFKPLVSTREFARKS